MTNYSNTNPEQPFELVDASTLRRRREAAARSCPTNTSKFGPTLSEVVSTPSGAEALYQRILRDGGPLVESGDDGQCLVTFVYRASPAPCKVFVLGQLTHNQQREAAPPATEYEMTRIPGTNIWGLTVSARRSIRTTYRIYVSYNEEGPDFWEKITGSETDVLNPRSFGGEEREPARVPALRRPESILELDHAPYAALGLSIPSLRWDMHWFRSEILDNTRRIWTWCPQASPVGVVLLHDGYDWVQRTRIAQIVAELTMSGALPPLLLVAVETLRGISTKELGCDFSFTEAIVKEIIPWIYNNWVVPQSADRIILAGQSWGGLNVAYTALRYPDVAHNIISQSGSFWYSPDKDRYSYGHHGWLIEQFRNSPVSSVRFYLQVGALEGSMVTINRHMYDVLALKGYEVTLSETDDNHSWYSWQFTIVDGLLEHTRSW